MKIRIEGRDLPGRDCPPCGHFPGYEEIHVGIQGRNRPDDLLDLVPGDAESAAWTIDASLAAGTKIDLTGPYVQGIPGDRFIYLSWGALAAGGRFAMFRRAKLLLSVIDPDLVATAARARGLLAQLRLTDSQGNPVCGRVKPPEVSWSAW